MKPQQLGAQGELLARKYLEKQGYRFLDRNFRTPYGEIDLIFRDHKTLVFVEVKTRWSAKYGKPEEAVTPQKINSIIQTAKMFLVLNKKLPKQQRIDVVAINVTSSGELIGLRHIKNITG